VRSARPEALAEAFSVARIQSSSSQSEWKASPAPKRFATAPRWRYRPAFVHRLYALFSINNGMTRLTVETAIVALEDRGGGQEQVGVTGKRGGELVGADDVVRANRARGDLVGISRLIDNTRAPWPISRRIETGVTFRPVAALCLKGWRQRCGIHSRAPVPCCSGGAEIANARTRPGGARPRSTPARDISSPAAPYFQTARRCANSAPPEASTILPSRLAGVVGIADAFADIDDFAGDIGAGAVAPEHLPRDGEIGRCAGRAFHHVQDADFAFPCGFADERPVVFSAVGWKPSIFTSVSPFERKRPAMYSATSSSPSRG